MKNKSIKTILTTALAGVIVVGNVMVTNAATVSGNDVTTPQTPGTTETVSGNNVTTPQTPGASETVSGNNVTTPQTPGTTGTVSGNTISVQPSGTVSDGAGTPAAVSGGSVAVQRAAYTSNTVSFGGTVIKSTVAGVFIAPNVNGVAVTTPIETVNALFGLAADQKATVMVLEANAKNSPESYAVAQSAAANIRGNVVAMLNIEFGFRQNGRYTDLSDSTAKAEMAVGLPAAADTGKTYKVLTIKAGGAVTVSDDLDKDPNTVTIAFGGGKAAYALVAID